MPQSTIAASFLVDSGGSGSTLIGCEQTDRRAFLTELDQAYCDVIVQRWEEFTGGKAERYSAVTS